MTESHANELPAQVRRRDGRVVPFDPDMICQAIFLAGELLEQPNAFLAREMTDGVLHFLTQEHGAGTPTTEQIAELVIKVLRELGQPLLAQAFAKTRASRPGPSVPAAAAASLSLDLNKTPDQFVDECRRLFSRHNVFSRDLQAAQDEGFLSIAGLEHPAELEGGVIPWPAQSLLGAIVEARRRFGSFVVVDSPEHILDLRPPLLAQRITDLVEQIEQGVGAAGLKAIVNLNAAEMPPWAQLRAQGPLFQDTHPPDAAAASADVRLNLLDALLKRGDHLRIDWHLAAHDFQDDNAGLQYSMQAASRGLPVNFVFDRHGANVLLAEGVDRRHAAVLQVVGLHLDRLADMPGVDGKVENLLSKLLHLAQMAVSAGVQKRRFLKQLAEKRGSMAEDLRRGFFLDRARLCVIPVGLPAVVQRFAGEPMTGKLGLALARQIIERLGQCLLQAGRTVNLDGVLESPWWTHTQPGSNSLFAKPHLTGLTSADFAASAEDQLRAAGALHQLAGSGTATLLLPSDLAGNLGRLQQLLHFAWKKTGVVRVRLARIPSADSIV